jgi:hypothetical protein
MTQSGGESRELARREPDAALYVVLGAGAEVTFMVLRSASRIGTGALRVTTKAGEWVLLVPAVGNSIRALDQRWRADRQVLAERTTSLLSDLSNRVLEGVLATVDLTSLVLRNLDLDRVVDRVDVQRVIDRVDIVGVAENVIEELDVPEMIRESSGTLAADTIEGLRIQGMNADSSLTRLMDRLLRRGDVDTPNGEVAPPAAGGSTPPPTGRDGSDV